MLSSRSDGLNSMGKVIYLQFMSSQRMGRDLCRFLVWHSSLHYGLNINAISTFGLFLKCQYSHTFKFCCAMVMKSRLKTHSGNSGWQWHRVMVTTWGKLQQEWPQNRPQTRQRRVILVTITPCQQWWSIGQSRSMQNTHEPCMSSI